MFIIWSQKFEVGNDLIDTQHRMLAVLCMKLELAVQTEQAPNIIRRSLQEISKFVEFHFFSEEALMVEVRYPDLAHHRRAHGLLLAELKSTIVHAKTQELTPAMAVVLIEKLLIKHMSEEDSKLAEHITRSRHRPIGEELYAQYFVHGRTPA